MEIANRIGLRAVQLHGGETAEDARWMVSASACVIKAFPAGAPGLGRLRRLRRRLLLVDAADPGSGEVFDWRAGRGGRRPGLGSSSPVGSPPDNVGAAVAHLHPGVSTCRRASSRRPGVKDPVKLRAFIAAARRPPAAASAGGTPRPDGDGDRDDGPGGARTTGGGTGERRTPRRATSMGDPGPTAASASSAAGSCPSRSFPACLELEAAFRSAWADPAFLAELDDSCRTTADGPRRSPSARACRSISVCGCCSSGRT